MLSLEAFHSTSHLHCCDFLSCVYSGFVYVIFVACSNSFKTSISPYKFTVAIHVLEPLQSRLETLLSQPRDHGGDAVQVIELLRESEVEKVGLIGGDQVQHSLRFQDLGLELGDLEIDE
ncbi:hypothetical protein FCV25MIE_07926 [Fagus crenata]